MKNMSKRDIFYAGFILFSFITITVVGLLDRAHDQANYNDIEIKIILAVICGFIIGAVYLWLMLYKSKFLLKIFGKYSDIDKPVYLKRYITLDSTVKLKRLSIIHLPLISFWIYPLHLKVPIMGYINFYVFLLVILSVIFLFIVQYYEITVSKINSFFHFAAEHQMTQGSMLFLLLGASFLMLAFFVLIIAVISFMIGFSLSKVILPLAFFITALVTFLAVIKNIRENKIRKYIIIISILIGAFIIFSAISSRIYNFGFDSQAYHSEIIIQMEKGWNPYHETIRDGDYDYVERNTLQTAILNCFSRGSEIISASTYKFLGSYEGSKVFQFIFILAAYFISTALFLNFVSLGKFKAILLGFLVTMNPVTVMESLSFKCDGQIASILLVIISLCALLFFFENTLIKILLVASIIIGVNLKFTSPIYIIIILAGVLFVFLLLSKNKFNIKTIRIIVISLLIGMIFIGFNPYITNIINYGSPFFPFFGSEKISGEMKNDNFDNLKSEDLKKSGLGMNRYKNHVPTPGNLSGRLSRLFRVTFSETRSGDYSSHKIKFPFIISKSEIPYYLNPGPPNLGGFGPFFGGILLLTILLFLFTTSVSLRKAGVSFVIFLWILGSVIITGKGVYARYAPQFWLVPFIFMLFGMMINRKMFRLIINFAFVLLIINFLVVSINYYKGQYSATRGFQLKYKDLLKDKEPIKLMFYYKLRSCYKIRFKDMGIKFDEVLWSGDNHADVVVYRSRIKECIDRYLDHK